MKKALILILACLTVLAAVGCVKVSSEAPRSSESEETNAAAQSGGNEPAETQPEPQNEIVGVWICDKTGYTSPEYYPKIVFKADQTFEFTVNLYEGMGLSKGTYEITVDTVRCSVQSKNFSGFTGDKLTEYVFRIESGSLIYESTMIGMTDNGDRFDRQ